MTSLITGGYKPTHATKVVLKHQTFDSAVICGVTGVCSTAQAFPMFAYFHSVIIGQK